MRAASLKLATAAAERRVPLGAPASPARVCIARIGERSAVRAAFASSPLRLLTPKNHGRAAWVYTSLLGGGLVNGDRVRLDLEVSRGAGCVLSSQGESRVYRSPGGCSHQLRATVEKDGLLAVIPDPTVCFAGARYQQRTEIRLERTASLVFADVLLAGRTARGERWAFARYAAELGVRVGSRAVLEETILLDPAHGPLAQRFGRFDAFATLILAGAPLRAEAAHLREQSDALGISTRPEEIMSASPLGEDALLVRMAAVTGEAVVHRLRALLGFLPGLLGDDPWARRN